MFYSIRYCRPYLSIFVIRHKALYVLRWRGTALQKLDACFGSVCFGVFMATSGQGPQACAVKHGDGRRGVVWAWAGTSSAVAPLLAVLAGLPRCWLCWPDCPCGFSVAVRQRRFHVWGSWLGFRIVQYPVAIGQWPVPSGQPSWLVASVCCRVWLAVD